MKKKKVDHGKLVKNLRDLQSVNNVSKWDLAAAVYVLHEHNSHTQLGYANQEKFWLEKFSLPYRNGYNYLNIHNYYIEKFKQHPLEVQTQIQKLARDIGVTKSLAILDLKLEDPHELITFITQEVCAKRASVKEVETLVKTKLGKLPQNAIDDANQDRQVRFRKVLNDVRLTYKKDTAQEALEIVIEMLEEFVAMCNESDTPEEPTQKERA